MRLNKTEDTYVGYEHTDRDVAIFLKLVKDGVTIPTKCEASENVISHYISQSLPCNISLEGVFHTGKRS
jgi:hypothetical protein